MGARKSSIKLFQTVTVVPPEKTMPFTAGEVVEIAPLSEMSQTLFLDMFTAVPLLTEMPLAMGEVVPEPERVVTLLPVNVWVVPPVIEMPVTVADAPDEERLLTELPEKV